MNRPDKATIGARIRTYRALLVISASALGLRLVLVFVVHPMCPFDADSWDTETAVVSQFQINPASSGGCVPLRGDSSFIYLQGRMVGEGMGFSDPSRYILTQKLSPSGWKPPFMPMVIGGLARVGITSPDGMRVVSSLMAGAAVFIIGYLAWKLAGRRAGIAAALIATLYPMLWINDWRMLQESPLSLVVALILLLSYRFWAKPTPWRAVAIGAAIGFSGHIRFEMPLLFFFMLAPLVFGIRHLRFSAQLKLGIAASLAGLAVLSPWWLFNLVRFNQTTITGTGSGWGLKNGTCDTAWFGDHLGYLDFGCLDIQTRARGAVVLADPNADESDADAVFRESAVEYIRANLGRFPVVAAARAGRVWDVYAPFENTEFNITFEGRGSFDSWAGLATYYALLPFGAAGVVAMYRRRITVAPMLGVGVVVTLAAIGGFGLTRYRLPADVVLCVVAAIGIDVVAERLRRSRLGQVDGTRPTSPPRKPLPRKPENTPSNDISAAATRMSAAPRLLGMKALAAGSVGLIALVGVLYWSASLEPAPAAQTAPREGINPEVCTQLDQLGIGALASAVPQGNAPRAMTSKAVRTLESIEAVAPPEVMRDAAIMRTFLLRYTTATGQRATPWLSIPQAERTEATDATMRLIDFQWVSC